MATPTEAKTDKGMGMALIFGVLTVIGALAMLVTAPDATAGWGFAAAVLFGSFAIVAIHVYWE